MDAAQKLSDFKQAFERRFGSRPRVFRAPGRTNLIGEHTDYNDGFVLPAAIDRSTWVAIAARGDRGMDVTSEHFAETVGFDLDDARPAARRHWSDYVRGVALMMKGEGCKVSGADLLIRSDVPLGAGVSSSASLEVAAGLALAAISGCEIPRLELAKLCQRAENDFVGARCGVMDQFVACFGKEGHALFLDCRTLEYANVPLPGDVRLVLCNTMVKHEIAGGEYNKRREECEEAVRQLARVIPGVRALRDVTPEQVEAHRAILPGALFKRARHVTTEDARVPAARDALKRADLATMGKLMAESHASLREDYEVSCRELDVMVELAHDFDGCHGARMTGGGFGGCTINLVSADKCEGFATYMRGAYQQATGIAPEVYVCNSAGGASEVV
ncbi:MAG TPA: galactokinase [Candidatus Acidoferrales bacterium]|jgi:galactokinase|nr:galactokinase [Candidatus Acidoferrales bacterium]